MNFKLGELFCGPGGIGLGAKNAVIVKDGLEYLIDHAWATDYDKDTCLTFSENICPNNADTVLCKDIRKLKWLYISMRITKS